MDYLRQGIHLRGYAQKDYRYEYKREAFELFAAMLERIKFDTVTILATLDVQVKSPEQIEREEEARRARLNRALQAQHAEAASLSQLGAAGDEAPPQSGAARAAGAAPRRRRCRSSSRSVPCAPRPRWGATSRARAAAARNSRTATACSRESSRWTKPRLRVVAAALFDAERPRADRRAAGRQTHGRLVGISRRQGGVRRERRAGAGARAARRARSRCATRRAKS